MTEDGDSEEIDPFLREVARVPAVASIALPPSGTALDGRFVLAERVAGGGMGVVYRARDERTGETIAIKFIQHGEAAERFAREVKVLAALEHPGIVRYIAHGEVGGVAYLAMEWVDGGTLAERLARG